MGIGEESSKELGLVMGMPAQLCLDPIPRLMPCTGLLRKLESAPQIQILEPMASPLEAVLPVFLPP